MKTFTPKYVIAFVLSVVLSGLADADAQKIKILNISHGNKAASIKAEVLDAGEKKIKSIVARTFYMPTGSSTTCDDYKVFDGRYVVANVDYQPGSDYFYRLEATFDDDSVVKTDCYNETYTEGAVWLSDLPVNSKNPADCAVGVDCCVNGKPLQLHPTSYFDKGISIKSVSEISFNTSLQNEHNVKFTYTRFQFGLQAYAADGSDSNAACRVIFKMNGRETGSKGNMKPYSNPTRGSSPYYFAQTEVNDNGINSVGLRIQGWGTPTDDDYVVLGACRLYYTVPPSGKEVQTITFDASGGYIFKDNPEVRIGAYASGNTPVFYSIIQGSDIATLDENNVLRPMAGKKGEVVVEAFTLGDDTFAPASATVAYKFNFAPTVEYAYCHKDAENNKQQTLYLHVEPQDKQLEKLQIDIYDDVRSFTKIKTFELTGNDLQNYSTIQPNLYAFPFANEKGGEIVHRITYKFSGEEEVITPLHEGVESFLYMSDIQGMTLNSGWGTCSVDIGFGSTGKLATTKYTYGKGIGIHAAGYVETPTSFSLAPFYRFATDIGGQPLNNGNTRSARMSYQLHNGVSTAAYNTGNVSWQDVYEWNYELQSTGAGKTLKITAGHGGDGNQNDMVAIGAPRFYYATENLRAPQTIDWKDEEVVNDYKPFTLALTASATSKLPVFYRIVSGKEYAKLVDGDAISVAQMPDSAVIVVEAFQPGNKEYMPSNVKRCTFRLRKSVIVEKDARTELTGGHDIDELIVYADANSCGQVSVKNGVVNVRNLKLKYTFTPGQWTHIAFPSDMDISKISDLTEKGFSYSTDEGTPGTFIIREYDTRKLANAPGESPWVSLSVPIVKGMKGYIMKIESEDEAPVEITFSISNTHMAFDNTMCNMFLNVNMRNCEPETRHTVYVRPVNVKGNTLRVDMRYVPTDPSELPLNHAKALEAMRVTRTPVRGAIRLTLPDQTPARVAIFDRKGKRLLKAVNYISPMKIDITDLKPGTYRMVVVYGPASRELLVEL